METPTAAGRQSSVKVLLGSTLLLALACAGTAPAAPCTAPNYDIAAWDLKGAAVPLNELAVRSVDLGDTRIADEPAVSADVTGSMAPLLFLAPRVTTILEDVFAAGEMPAGAADENGDLAAAEAPQPLRRSPVAETDSADRAAPPSPETDHASVLPKYQRQMYRTDI